MYPLKNTKNSLGKKKSPLVNYEYDSDDNEHTDEEETVNNEDQDKFGNQSNSNSTVVLHNNVDSDHIQIDHPLIFPEDAEIRIPPEPTKSCSSRLEKKFEEYYKRFKKTGIDENAGIQGSKDFRNPCTYETMISHWNIDEIGTNFPQELYDPRWREKEPYYEELSKAQKFEMDRREKERRERTKIGFTPGVEKVDQLGVGSSTNSEMGGEKRKTRFDQ